MRATSVDRPLQHGADPELDPLLDVRYSQLHDGVAEAVGATLHLDHVGELDAHRVGDPALIEVASLGNHHQPLAQVADRLRIGVGDVLMDDVGGSARRQQVVAVVIGRQRLQQLVVQEGAHVEATLAMHGIPPDRGSCDRFDLLSLSFRCH
jgi:hypothetical protein